MLEQLVYKNHLGEVFEFGKDGIFVNTSDLHDYEWQVNTRGNKISSFSYGTQTRTLPVIIICASAEEGIAARNRLFEVCEKDVLAFKQGEIILGGYSFRCFVTKSAKKDYLVAGRYMTADLTLTSDYPVWTKETVFTFVPVTATETASEYLDYQGLDFPYDYFSTFTAQSLSNDSFAEANFKLRVFGACSNPSVTIGGHTYQVNCTLEDGQYLTVDSLNKRIFVTKNDGSTVNAFNLRSREDYIFQKIPAGINTVSFSGNFSFDVILLEERSEPKWT